MNKLRLVDQTETFQRSDLHRPGMHHRRALRAQKTAVLNGNRLHLGVGAQHALVDNRLDPFGFQGQRGKLR